MPHFMVSGNLEDRKLTGDNIEMDLKGVKLKANLRFMSNGGL
jgi:hypothetical protein